MQVEEQKHNEYVVRVIQVSNKRSQVRRGSGEAEADSSDVKLVYQLHYAAWPDHGIPTAIEPIFDMLAYARQYQPTEEKPIVVHCRYFFSVPRFVVLLPGFAVEAS